MTRALRHVDRHLYLATLTLCVLVARLGLYGGDLAAQTFRTWLFRTHGFVLWDSRWFGGHTDVGYGPLFPVLASVLGIITVGIIACVASTMLFCALVPSNGTMATAAARAWFSVVVVVDLVVGRLPFACGLACGMATVLAIRDRRPWLALLAAVGCSLFSPLAALFLLLVGAAWATEFGWRRVSPVAGGFIGLLIAQLGGDGGRFPFPGYMLTYLLLLAVGLLIVIPSRLTAARRGVVLYGVACVVLFIVPNPVGGNLARLASLIAAPLVLLGATAVRRRTVPVVTAIMLGLLFWQTLPVGGAIAASRHDASSSATYYAGVVAYLEGHAPVGSRVEVVPTAEHWESVYVAEHVSIARGWDRQVDLGRNDILYGPLTTREYRSWLDANAVAYVALPRDTPLDYGAKSEAGLLATPPSWLRTAYSDAHGHVWAVTNPQPMATGAAHVTADTPGGFDLDFTKPGTALVREYWSPYFTVQAGAACVGPAPHGVTNVISQQAGSVAVVAVPRPDAHHRCPSIG